MRYVENILGVSSSLEDPHEERTECRVQWGGARRPRNAAPVLGWSRWGAEWGKASEVRRLEDPQDPQILQILQRMVVGQSITRGGVS